MITFSNNDCDHTEGPGHDCHYVNERNSLIRKAEQEANKLCPATPAMWANQKTYEEWSTKWDRVFLNIMNLLMAEKQANDEIIKKAHNEN